jgi:hypothetical protein
VPAVVGAADIHVMPGEIDIGGTRYLEGDTITVDGSTGHVYRGVVTGEGQPMAEAQTLLRWARDAGIEPVARDAGIEPVARDPGIERVTPIGGVAGTPEAATPAAAPPGART